MSDTSTASELLIKIKTTLESQGVDAAKKQIDEMVHSTNSSTTEMSKSAKAQAESTREMEKATRAALAMNHAVEGGVQGFRGLSHMAYSLGGTFGDLAMKVSLVGAAFTAGWKVGTMIREHFIEPVKESEEAIKKAKDRADEMHTAISKVNQIRMEEMVAGIKAVADEYTRAVGQAERLSRLEKAKNDAQLGSELATNQLEFESGHITEAQRNRKDLLSNEASEKRKLDIDEAELKRKRDQAAKERSDAESRLDSFAQEKTRATHDQATLTARMKGAGYANPDDITSENVVALRTETAEKLKVAQAADAEMNRLANPQDGSIPRDYAEAHDKVKEQIQTCTAILADAAQLAAAKKAVDLANQKLKSKEATEAKSTITSKGDEISDLDAQLGLIPQKRETVATKFQAEKDKLRNTESLPEKLTKRTPAELQAQNDSILDRLLKSVQPLAQEPDGSTSRGAGRETQTTARELIKSATAHIEANHGDTKEDQQVIADLVEALTKNQTVMKTKMEDLAGAMRIIEANTAAMQKIQTDQLSREQNSPSIQ